MDRIQIEISEKEYIFRTSITLDEFASVKMPTDDKDIMGMTEYYKKLLALMSESPKLTPEDVGRFDMRYNPMLIKLLIEPLTTGIKEEDFLAKVKRL